MSSSTHTAVSGSTQFGPFVLDRAGGRLLRGRREQPLRPKAWLVLCHLIDHAGELVPIDALLDAAWPETSVTPQALTNVVGEIRTALREDATHPRWIETVRGRGYRFRAETRPVQALSGSAGSSVQTTPPPPLLVGRECELQQLHELWREACSGVRRTVFVTGDAGIGKTSLTLALLERVSAGAEQTVVARGGCVEQHDDGEPYLPLLSAVDELARGPWKRTVQAELRRCAPTWQYQMPWLLRSGESDRLESSLHGATAVRMLREGATFFETLARRRPLLLILDDLHWSDASTVEFLNTLAQRDTPARLMVVAVFRGGDAAFAQHVIAEVARDMCLHGRATQIALGPLSRRNIEDYLATRLGDRSSVAALAPRVEEQASGNPLFVRSVVEHLLEASSGHSDGDASALAQSAAMDELEMPDALRAVVSAQLARMEPDVRALIETASVAGQDFTTREVSGALELDESQVDEHCERLAKAGRLIDALGTASWPDGSRSGRYRFRHALYRRAVFDGISTVRRQETHHRIAVALEGAWADRAREVATRLAVHYEQGGNRHKAIDYLESSASNAARRFAYPQGVDAIRQALAMLRELPEDEARDRREAKLQRRLSSMLTMATGLASQEAGEAIDRAFELADRIGDEPGKLMAASGLAIHLITAARFRDARPHVERLLAVGRTMLSGLLPLACCYAAYERSAAGDLSAAEKLLDEGARNRADAGIPTFMDTERMVISQLALVLTERGELDRARSARDEALARAHARGVPVDLAHAAVFAAEAAAWQRDREAGIAAASLAVSLGEENGLVSYGALGRFYHAWFTAGPKRSANMVAALADRRAAGDRWQESALLALIAQAELEAGRADAALARIDEAEAFVADTGERHFEAELARVRGRCLAVSGGDPAAGAVDCYRSALRAARSTGAHLFALRAATALADAHAGAPQREDSLHELADTIAQIDDSGGGDDLREAKELYERLASA